MKKSCSKNDFAKIKNNRRRVGIRSLILSALFMTAVALFVFQPSAQAAGPRFFNFFPQANPFAIQPSVWERAERPAKHHLAESLPDDFSTVRLNKDALVSVLQAAPHEAHLPLGSSWTILPLPMPDGSMMNFRIQEAPVLEPSMVEKFPDIKSYRAVSVEDPTVTGRFDLTPLGFHGFILTSDQIVAILPAEAGDSDLYASFTDEHISAEEISEMCSMTEKRLKGEKAAVSENPLPEVASGAQLRTYRIAIAATWEYANSFGGTTAGTVASINTWLNSVNAIYEREVAVRLLLVNNMNILYTTERGFTAATDPFTDGNDRMMLDEVVPVMNQHVGSENFNVGHVFATQAGLAGLGVVCGPSKAKGASTMAPPAGSINSVLRFAHELGHQFGAPHTYNATGGCNDSRTGENAYETGSGTTIMSYAGNCPGHNLELPTGKEARFHARSIEQINNFVSNGGGAACPTVSPTGNTPPTVTTPAAFNIPKNTPFTLTATGNDPDAGDNNNLTYTWEQYDAAGEFSNGPYNDAGDPANTTRPIFRPFAPNKNPARTFPSLKYILENANDPPDTVPGIFGPEQTAEELPRIGRTLNFRVTVRDNIGGVNDASTSLTVDGNSGPFNVTAPNTPVNWAGGSTQNITWNVAGTNNAPVSAANVKISLSTDGGQSFPTVLEASTPNDGAQNVLIPNGVNTTTARVKIEAVGNVFFDISDANFSIAPGGACAVVTDISPKVAAAGGNVVITGVNLNGVTTVRFGGNVNATFTVDSATQITATVPAGAVGGAITVSKPNCGEAQTAVLTVCQGAPASLQIDSGTLGGRGGAGVINNIPQTHRVFNRLTPASYPATISAVLINVSDRLPLGTAINIHVGANPGGMTNIDGLQLTTYARTVTAHNNFAAYQIPSLTIASGDFVVGYSYATGTPGANFDNAPPQNRSYRSNDGVNFIAQDSNVMIRAQVFTGNCTPAACSYNINPTTQNFAAAGTGSTINITTEANCPWTATRSANWINFTSPSTGNGNGALNFTVAANNTAAPRTGTITVGDKTFTVTQDAGTAPTCTYTLDPAGGVGYPSSQQTGRTFNVIAAAGCQWTAVADQNWITITGGATGTGNGTVTFNLAQNPNAAMRSGSITVAGVKFLFDQFGSAPVCNFALNPATVNLGATAGAGQTFAVNVGANCPWNAATSDNWITITGGTGNGGGTVTFSVASNPAANNRVGTITVGGQALTVNQGGTAQNCNYVLNPTNAQLGATAAVNNTFGVAAPAGCQWTAATNDNWINITGGINGAGNGTVTYSLNANTGAARNGTITVQGQNFTVTQAAGDQPCTPVTGGLVNWYRAENNALDARSGNNGTVAGDLNYGEGFTARGFVLNGTNSFVSIQRQIADDFTIEFWVKVATNVTGGANETDWRQGMGLVGTANDDFGVSLGNGKVLFGVGDATVASNTPINDDLWYHVVATRKKSTGAMRLYLDGGNGGPTVGTGNTNTLNASPQLLIGRRGQNGAFLAGSIDEVKIFTSEFSNDQARAAFRGCAAGEARIGAENQTAREGNPGQNTMSYVIFTVRLSHPSEKEVCVHYFTEDLTAIEGLDYVGGYGSIVIQPGETVGTISIPILTNTSDEPDRAFLLRLYDPINGVISDDDAIGTILDDDAPCEASLSSALAELSPDASAGHTFSVKITPGCRWTASTTDPGWINIIGNPGGDENGTVTFSVTQNKSHARTGIIAAAGQAFTVKQAAAPVLATVAGKVVSKTGAAIRNAQITLTDQTGNRRTTLTNPSGQYSFADVEPGQIYIISVSARGYVFRPSTQTFKIYREGSLSYNFNFTSDN